MGAGPRGRGLGGRNVNMEYFAFVLSRLLDRNVIDRTGLAGAEPPPNADGPTVFTALREQLGLRLEATRGPVEFLVVGHAEKPSGN
jgi:hypothetical protein